MRECTGISGDGEDAKILNGIQCGLIDFDKCLSARRELDEAGYRQWLRDALAEAEEASDRELIEMFGEPALAAVAESVASASQEGEDR